MESCPDSLAHPHTPYPKAQDMSSRPFERPLLPVPSAVASPVGNTIRPRVKKASSACTECRKRKSKAMLSFLSLFRLVSLTLS
ncbi:hypothetical protein BDV11DRAFT_192670 [Aspergillus similis]